MSSIDNNREQLKNVEAYTRILNMSHLIAPINEDDVPMYSTTELKSVEVDTSSPQNSEKLVDISLYGIKTLAYYKEEAHNNPTYNSDISGAPDIIYAREGVCEKLKKVNEDLSPLGLEIIVYDAHRSPATQKRLYMHFVKVAYQKGLKGEDAQNFAAQYCSNPEGFDKNNPKTWTMHSTGAAVDVYLLDKKTGRIIDMGEGYFDNPNEVTHTRHYEVLEKNGSLTDEQKSALLARRILFNVMKNNGFYNYGSELFHYEYEGLIKAKVLSEKSGKPVMAKYGYIQSPADNAKANIITSLLLNAKNHEKQ